MIDGLEGIMNLAAASGEDLATTSDIVTDALTAFGLSAKDTNHFVDVLAVASSNANTNVGMMGETFKYVAPAAGAMGYSVEDMAEAIGLMANSGIKASSAGTALRSIITRLGTDAGASSTKLGALGILTKELGVQFYDSQGNARDFGDVLKETRLAWKGLDDQQAIAYANQIAGKNALSGWMALMNASEEDINKLSTAIANADGTASAMSDTMNNNLSGALAIFNSALEGLGLAVYDKVAGPLTDLVEFGTGMISAITGWIDPAKSELDEYIDSIKNANEQIRQNLDSIQEALDKDLGEASQIEAYKELFSDVVASGEKLESLSISDMVSAMVMDVDTLSKDGLALMDKGFLDAINAVGGLKESDILGGALESSTSEITEDISGVGGAADVAETDVDEFGDVVVEVFKGVGESATGAGQDITDLGTDTVQTFEGIDSTVEGSSSKIKEFFAPVKNEETFWVTIDSLTGKMEVMTNKEHEAAEAKGELLGKSSMQVDHSFDDYLIATAENLENVIMITDDFQKKQVTKAIQVISKLKPEAKDLWNEQYGILSNNVELINDIINLEAGYLASQAFAKERSAIYEAQGEAYMSMYKAESAANNALNEINKALEENGLEVYGSIAEALDGLNRDEEIRIVSPEAISNLHEANAQLEEANGLVEDCTKRLDENTAAQEYYQEKTGISSEMIEEFGSEVDSASESTQQATGDINDLAGEEENYTEATDDAAEATAEFSKELQKATEEAIKDQQKALQDLEKEYQSYRDEYAKTISAISKGDEWNYGALEEGEKPVDLRDMAATMQHNMAELNQWKSDMETLADQVGNTISVDFFSYILEQGPEYGKYIRAMVEDLRTTGGAQLASLSKIFEQSGSQESAMSAYFANMKFVLNENLHEVAEGLDYHEFWTTVGDSLTEESSAAIARLKDATEAATSIGAGIPEKLAEGMQSGDISVEQGIDVINTSIINRLQGLVDQAREMGVEIPDGLIEGVESGETSAQMAFNRIVNAMGDEAGIRAKTQGKAVGTYFLSSIVDGMNEDPTTMEIYDRETGEVIDTVVDGIAKNVDGSAIGEKMAKDSASAVETNKGTLETSATDMVDNAEGKAESTAEDFEQTGKTVVDSAAGGVKKNADTFTKQVDALMSAGLKKADEWDDDFEKAGKDIPAQVGNGITGNQKALTDAVSGAVQAGIDAIDGQKTTFEGKGKEVLGAVGTGMSDSVSQQNLKTALSNALTAASNVDTSYFSNIGTQISNGIAQGITNNSVAISNAATSAAQAAYDAATATLQIQSPSKVMEEGVGKYISLGVAKGITDEEGSIVSATQSALSAAYRSASEYAKTKSLASPEMTISACLVPEEGSYTSSLQLGLDKLTGYVSDISQTIANPDDLVLVPVDSPNPLLASPEPTVPTVAGYVDADISSLSNSDLGERQMVTALNTASLESAIQANTASLERLVQAATLMLNAAKTMGEKVGVTIINELDGEKFDTRIRNVSMKAINQRSKNLAYAGGK